MKMLILLVLIIRGPEAGPNERTAFYASSWKMHRPDHCLVHVRLQAYVPRRKSVVVSSILLNHKSQTADNFYTRLKSSWGKCSPLVKKVLKLIICQRVLLTFYLAILKTQF